MGALVEAFLQAVLRDEWNFHREEGTAGGGPSGGAEAWCTARCTGKQEMHVAPP